MINEKDHQNKGKNYSHEYFELMNFGLVINK